jgi:acyl transferase domain-containing protein
MVDPDTSRPDGPGEPTVLVFEGQGATALPAGTGREPVDLTTLPAAEAQQAIVHHQLDRAEAQRREEHAEVVAVLGQSLGEVSALVAAGSLNVDDARRVVQARADLPGQLLAPHPWTMASMTRLAPDRAADVAGDLDLWVAGRNSPNDCIVVGRADAFETLVDRLHVSPNTYRLLPVTAPYHTPAMVPVAEALADLVDSLDLQPPRVPVLSPTGPCEITAPEDARRVLVEALTTPVAWSDVLALAAPRWPGARWRECGPTCSLRRFVGKNHLKLDWKDA